MAGIYTLAFITVSYIVGGVWPYCNQMVYSDGHGQFDGYMGLVSHFEEISSRSLLACDRRCVITPQCKGFTFEHDTGLCHLFNYTLTDTAGLTPSANAVYYSKSEILPGTFICPPADGGYHYVNSGSSCIQVKAGHTYRNHNDAAADCESSGGRLFLLNNLDKRALYITLRNCGWSYSYTVDGNNENATDFNAVDAFTTKYGDVVPVVSPLWSGYTGSWSYYRPTTEHCLYFHGSHFHTTVCTSTRYYMCEK